MNPSGLAPDPGHLCAQSQENAKHCLPLLSTHLAGHTEAPPVGILEPLPRSLWSPLTLLFPCFKAEPQDAGSIPEFPHPTLALLGVLASSR